MPEASSTRPGVARWFAEARDAPVSVFLPAGCRLCERLLVRGTRFPDLRRMPGVVSANRHKYLANLWFADRITLRHKSDDQLALNFDPLCAACRLQAYRFDPRLQRVSL